MDDELKALLEQSRSVTLTAEEVENNRIALAAANGRLNDDRISEATMRATRTIMLADETSAA